MKYLCEHCNVINQDPLAITPSREQILEKLNAYGELSIRGVSVIGNKIPKRTIEINLDQLMDLGYIKERREEHGNQDWRYLSLTDLGKTFLRRIKK